MGFAFVSLLVFSVTWFRYLYLFEREGDVYKAVLGVCNLLDDDIHTHRCQSIQTREQNVLQSFNSSPISAATPRH